MKTICPICPARIRQGTSPREEAAQAGGAGSAHQPGSSRRYPRSLLFEPEIRNDLPVLPELFNQISGVLLMLGLDRAGTLLDSCRDLVEKLTDPNRPLDQAEQILLADALVASVLYRSTQKCPVGFRGNFTATINQFNQKLAGQSLSTDIPAISAEPALTAPEMPSEAATDQLYDPELLAIFLDESTDVLASIAAHLEACYGDHLDLAALTAIRRDFHTLKGSGRMVKLEALSEVAWRIEQLMNRWLSEQKPATGELLDLLAESHRQFCNWCASLKRTVPQKSGRSTCSIGSGK